MLTPDDYTLSNGVAISRIGFGTWQIPDGAACHDAVAIALAHGYRHIDTARAYGNEASIGRAVRDSGIARDQVFVTSKLPAEIKDAARVRASFETTMQTLRLDYLDLYLIHAPWPWHQIGKDFSAQKKAIWRVFEDLYSERRVRNIGVSNFTEPDLQTIMNGCRIKPMANQIKFYIGNTPIDSLAFCRSHSIQVEGYSPLATGAILDNAQVKALALRYGKSVDQICIRYVLQQGVVALPKSVTPARIVQNAELDFAISAPDMVFLNGLTATVSVRHGPAQK